MIYCDVVSGISSLLDPVDWVSFNRICREIRDITNYQKQQKQIDFYTQKYGYYSLAYACNHGNLEIAKLLCEKLPHSQERIVDAFNVAIFSGYIEIVKYLYDNHDIPSGFLMSNRDIGVNDMYIYLSGVCKRDEKSINVQYKCNGELLSLFFHNARRSLASV